MPRSPYLAASIAIWFLGTIGCVAYAYQKQLAWRMVMAVLPALLLEASFYMAPGFADARQWLSRQKENLPYLLAGSALLPYATMSAGLGTFRLSALWMLFVLVAMAAIWYRVLPRNFVTDIAFLVYMAGVYLSSIFKDVYVNPFGKPELEVVGRMMWARVGIVAVLLMRRGEAIDFGFVPRKRDWWVGVQYYLYSLPLIVPLAFWTGFVKRPVFGGRTVLLAIGTFLAFLWVVGMIEEFFFRGLLQPLLSKQMKSDVAGLAVTSLLFGSVHLPFANAFPNWRFAFLATVMGVFYGLAYMRAGTIRASIVTHALIVTTWRVFLA